MLINLDGTCLVALSVADLRRIQTLQPHQPLPRRTQSVLEAVSGLRGRLGLLASVSRYFGNK